MKTRCYSATLQEIIRTNNNSCLYMSKKKFRNVYTIHSINGTTTY